MVNDHKLKCYAQTLKDLPDFDDIVELKSWETADAKEIDLKYMAFGKILSFWLSTVVLYFM